MHDEKSGNINFVIPTEGEDQVLGQLDNAYTKVSEMTGEESAFLNALILRNQPTKLLEIGVSAGGSSIVMLNAIKDFPDARLYSIDLSDTWYKDVGKKVGHFVDNYPELNRKWRLYRGGLALRFLDEIGEGIDFCLIDTAHTNPGEIFDVLMILPFLKEDAVIVFHDVSLHTDLFLKKRYLLGERSITNNLLMSAVRGLKYLQGNYKGDGFPNIAGVRISKDTRRHVFDLFNLLMIKWNYIPTAEQENEITRWFEKYYDKYYIDYLKKVFSYQKKIMVNNRQYVMQLVANKIFGN